MIELPYLIFYKPADDRGPACISIEVNVIKRYRHIWLDDLGLPMKEEWGWAIADTSVPLVPRGSDED
jgi:hypothetical protein